MDEDDDDTFDQDIIELEVDTVPPLPWLHHDTVAAAMVMASQIANAAGAHFMNLAMLAMGQSGSDYEQMLRRQFASETLTDISKLLEGGEDEGRIPGTGESEPS